MDTKFMNVYRFIHVNHNVDLEIYTTIHIYTIFDSTHTKSGSGFERTIWACLKIIGELTEVNMRSNTHIDIRWSRTTSTAPLLPSRSYHFHLSSSGATSAHHPQAANHPDSWCRILCVPPLHHLICVCVTSRPALCPWLTPPTPRCARKQDGPSLGPKTEGCAVKGACTVTSGQKLWPCNTDILYCCLSLLLFSFLAYHNPQHAHQDQRVLFGPNVGFF